MPPIQFRCPGCRAALSTSKGSPGDVVTCPACGRMVSVPGESPPPVPRGTPRRGRPAWVPYAQQLWWSAVGGALGLLYAIVFLWSYNDTQESLSAALPGQSLTHRLSVPGLPSAMPRATILACLIALWPAPAVLAVVRRHRRMPAVVALTAVGGFFCLTWAAALVWALSDPRRED